MDKYYVSGCKGQDDDIVTCDDSEAEFWTIYQRDSMGLSQGLVDFTFMEDAEAAMKVYVERDALQQKLDEAQEEIARRDAIFIPVYPDENLMNKLTDVFHDTAKIHCDEDGVYVDNAELVITAVINHYLQSPDRNQLRGGNTEGDE